jgi:GT2 family glycosyltransferase
MKLHVIMACHNRRDLSVRAVLSAVTAANFAQFPIDFTIFDDGSSDGTADGLLALDANITILKGDGSAFWAKSMALAESAVLAGKEACEERTCWIIWLNDDVTIDESAFQRAIEAGFLVDRLGAETEAVGVGTVRDPDDGSITYGGLRKTGWHPLRFSSVMPSDRLEAIDSFNGNLVFVPESVARKVDGIDGGFSHALADIDYGLRCQRLHTPVFLLPGTYGTCARNAPEASRGLVEEWRRFTGPKGGGNRVSMVRILKKGSPLAWPVYVSITYVLWLLRNLLKPMERPHRPEGGTKNERVL